ncbi:MAG: hypothetical protein J1D77_02995 [Muribaculaceae bacterium]|nr:hypothetical protein [Muribaculaceae bacterium]
MIKTPRFFKTISLFLLTWFLLTMAGGLPACAYGLIPVVNYQRTDYGFGTQNWDMTQDPAGRFYFANYNGLLAFDGQRWKHYYLPNYSTVRCLLYDKESDRIYAGGSEEFGYFAPSPINGELEYHSLSASIPHDNGEFSEVWDIIRISGNIIFRCDNCLYNLKDDKIEKLNIPGRISTSAQIGRKILLGMEDGRIFSLKDGSFSALQEEGVVEGNKIVGILPYEDNTILLCTPLGGLFLMKKGEISPFDSEYTGYLRNNQIFCATHKNGVYVFGTVTGGAVVDDSDNGEIHYINKEGGIKNNTVLKARFDRDNNLWLCLDNGVSFAALDSPCRPLIGESDFIGAGYASALDEGCLLLGTNQGLYLRPLEWRKNGTETVIDNLPLLQGQVWSITPNGEGYFISTDRGLYLYSDHKARRVEGLPGVYKTIQLPQDPDRAIASTYDSFHLLFRDGDSWQETGKVIGGEELKGDFLVDDYNRIWLPHWQKGIYMLPFNTKLNRFTSCQLFNAKTGLPADDNNSLALFEGSPVASTYAGFYHLDPERMASAKNSRMSEFIKNGRHGHLRELSNGSLVMVDEQGLLILRRDQDGNFTSHEISGPGIFNEIIPGFTDVQRLSPEELLVSTQSGFTIVNIRNPERVRHNATPFVSHIYANHDSLLYRAPLNLQTNRKIEISPDMNSLRFEFAYPECSFDDNHTFSAFLENYDKDWSPFSSESAREYTKLADGSYVLHLKVRDNYSGEVLESSFGFTVNPPWFRTTWAKTLYAVLSFLMLVFLFASGRRKMTQLRHKIEKRKEKELEDLRKESERDTMLKDMEIAGLKNEQLEQEIKHKSDELSATTMSLISKNEALREIGDQLQKIQRMAADSPPGVIQKSLSRLQASIEENISKDSDWNTFNKNFELVYGDYMKRLLKIHPDLSQSEKRLCCYIRMGLASKEIAPLINISFKSVEMARYRLRKKLSLSTEANLSEYLSSV